MSAGRQTSFAVSRRCPITSVGLTIVGDTLDNFLRYVRQAEEMGVEKIGMGDSQSLYHEMWVRTTLAAVNTQRVGVGTWCTNPLTRHPAVTASAAAAIDDLTGGRAFLGIGPGDSAVYNIGARPATLETLEAYIKAVRALLEEGRATWRGREASLTWAKGRIPIGMPASGPRALRMAGRLADIVWVNTGIQPEPVAQAYELLEQGAKEAGRSLEDLEVWWVALPSIGDSYEGAVDELKFALASYAHIIFRFTLDGKAVPPHLEERIRRLCDGYQSRFHVTPSGVNPNAQLVDELGLADYLAHRLAIVGTAEQCLQRIQEVRRHGVERLWFPIRFADKEPTMNGLQEVMAGLANKAAG